MAADGKWIEGLSATMPFAAAAKHALTVRLTAVAERLPDAVFHAVQDIEHVHQLRVSTRRAGAAVRIFGDCLTSKDQKALKSTLRKIRRAAGGARDWDVFEEAVAARALKATAAQKPGFDFLIGHAQGQRTAAQSGLDNLKAFADGEYAQLMEGILTAFDDTAPGDPLRGQATPRLVALLHELDDAAAQDLQDYENLHKVRIVGKNLRYAMEIFASCFAVEFREVIYPAVEEMQDILGKANDSHVAAQRLAKMREWMETTQTRVWERYRAGVELLMRSHQRQLPEQRRRFLKWWETWRNAGLEKRLEKMLR